MSLSILFYIATGILVVATYNYVQTLDEIFIQGTIVGFFLCLMLEVLAIFLYLRWRILKNSETSKITLNIITLEIEKMFEVETEEAAKARYKNNDFFINSFSNEKKLMTQVYRRDDTYDNFQKQKENGKKENNKSKNQENNESTSEIDGKNKVNNEHPEKKETIQEKKKHILEEIQTLQFEKVEKKLFLKKVNQFRKFLEIFINLEKNFAKDLRSIGKPRFLKTSMFDVVVKRDEIYQHSFLVDEVEPQFREDFNSIIQHSETRSRSFQSKMIVLPSWLYLKNIFLDMSKVHEQLVQYIQFGVFDLSKVLIEEYEDKYKKLKLLKNDAQNLIQKKMEDAKLQEQTYNDISNKIQDMAEIYKNGHQSQNKELARKRVELKGEIELLLYDKNNSKIKVYAGYEALHKQRQEANKINTKITTHKKEWEQRFQTMFKTSMKSIISGFYEMAKDIQKNMKTILRTNLKESSILQNENAELEHEGFKDNLSRKSSERAFNPHNRSAVERQKRDLQSSRMRRSIFGSIEGSSQNQNPVEMIASYRKSLIELQKESERYEREIDEIDKYEVEVTILIEDACDSLLRYVNEFESKISKCDQLSKLGEEIIYEQLGSFIQIDLTENSKRYLKTMVTQISKNLKPFHANTQRVLQDLSTEKKVYRKCLSAVESVQENLEKQFITWQQSRKSADYFHQKYGLIKVDLDEKYDRLYESKDTVEKIIRVHEKGVEEFKRIVVNSLVQYANQSSEKLEIIENNSDQLLTQDDENHGIVNESDVSSVKSNASIMSNASKVSNNKLLTLRRQSTYFAGNEFMHHQDEPILNGLPFVPSMMQDPQNKNAAKIVTQILKVFYHQWKDTNYFKEKIKRELYISLNKKLEDSLEEMVVTKLIIKGEGPDIKSIVPQQSEDYEFLLDLELSYKGTVYFEVDTAYHLDWPKPDSYKIPLTVKIKLNAFYSIIRVCYVPRVYGKSWFSFIGEPAISIDIDPIISKKYKVSRIPRVHLQKVQELFLILFDLKVKTLIQEIISQKIKKMTFPNRDSIKIPLSKADKDLSAIRNKLLHKKPTLNPENVPAPAQKSQQKSSQSKGQKE